MDAIALDWFAEVQKFGGGYELLFRLEGNGEEEGTRSLRQVVNEVL